MRSYSKLHLGFLIFIILQSSFTSCDYIRERNSIKDMITAEKITLTEDKINTIKETKFNNANDSLSKLLIGRYPNAYDLDSLNFSFTYIFQEALEKSSNVLYIRESLLRDIEKINDQKILSVYKYFPKTLGKLSISPQLYDRLLKEIEPFGFYRKISVVLKVSELSPIHADVSSTDEEEVRLGINLTTEPFYYIKGELIDFYLVK